MALSHEGGSAVSGGDLAPLSGLEGMGSSVPAAYGRVLVFDSAGALLAEEVAPVPEAMQGRSLLPLFQALPPEWREAIYYHYYECPGIHAVKRHYGVKTDRYKLVHFYYDVDEWELYDLERDPQELRNLYGQPEHAEQYGDSDELSRQMLEEDLARGK